VEYRFFLTGGEEDTEVRLRPFAIWTSSGVDGVLNMGGSYGGHLKICYFRKDGFLCSCGGGSEKVDEDGWYWDDQRLNHPPYKLSLDITKELLRDI
jgi:hypothetical protein